jgi:trimeric autotransporter adhesin
MATTELTITANIDGLRRQLEQIKEIGADQATAMANQLNKSIKAAEKASLAAAKASRAAADSAKASGRAASEALDTAAESATRFGDKAGAVGSNAGKLAGILDMLVPGLGGVARGVADVADTAEVASVATKGLGVSMSSTLAVLGPVAIAVAALGATYAYLSSELDEAERRQANAAEKATTYAEASARFAATTQEAADASAIATDAANGEAIAIRKATEAVKEGASAMRALAVEERDRAAKKSADFGTSQSNDAKAAYLAAQRAQADLDALDKRINRTAEERELVISLEYAKQNEAKKTAAAQIQAANAAAKRAADEAALAEVERLTLEQNAAYLQSIRSLKETARDANESQLTGAEAVEAAITRQIERVNALAKAQVEQSEGQAGQIANIEREQAAAVTAIRAKGQADIDAIYEAAAAKRADERAAELAAESSAQRMRAEATASATSSLLGATSDAFARAAEEQAKTNQDAAAASFAASKAAAVAQAVVNTALAISSANTLPPPANFIAMAAAGIAGAASLASIAAAPPPSFNDTPGVQQMGQRGNVSLASGDYFAAARSPTELQRQVGASIGAGGVSILQVKLGHKVLDQSVARTIQEGGRLSREISGRTKSGTTGHRVRA